MAGSHEHKAQAVHLQEPPKNMAQPLRNWASHFLSPPPPSSLPTSNAEAKASACLEEKTELLEGTLWPGIEDH